MTATVLYLPSARPGTTLGRADHEDWAADAHGVLDAVEDLLATGRTADVIAFCELAVAFLEANACDIDDPTPLVRLARRLGDLERRAATTTITTGTQRRRPRAGHRPLHPSIG
jgi:hypothetical protein